jgi:hypothetical protein
MDTITRNGRTYQRVAHGDIIDFLGGCITEESQIAAMIDRLQIMDVVIDHNGAAAWLLICDDDEWMQILQRLDEVVAQ